MNKRILGFLILSSFFSVWMFSCSKSEGETNISSSSSNRSHYKGENCMNCHYTEGPGEGWFSAAGSVYGDFLNHRARIFDANTGALLKIVQIDLQGNLYTTEEIDMTNGITIDIIDEQDNIVSVMQTVVFNAQCNLCHDDKYQGKIFL
ncbi:MAG: hypothetical protein H6579_03680 [Chitinophagales bacterium]|nr:hypothetical protein [Chitinophagales bacterium]